MRFGLRALAVACVIAIAGFAYSPPILAQSKEPFEIDALLSMTGYFAFVGQGEARSLHVLETAVNKSGGIKGRPLKFEFLAPARERVDGKEAGRIHRAGYDRCLQCGRGCRAEQRNVDVLSSARNRARTAQLRLFRASLWQRPHARRHALLQAARLE